ncbi:thioredoxin-like [Pristis pectinata]|uniref:thioredoxin-like n=1 Tax=Pristis pectinata TaxID=685728 RepID=UPI00223E3FF9|nr:thioredoxin-like [Pristis pectinata]
MVVHHLCNMDELTAKLKEAGDKLVVIDFYATWCGPCNYIKPIYAKYSEEHTDVIFCSVDSDEAEDITVAYDIKSLPTFIFFKKEKEVDKITGADKSQLESKIKELE